MGAKGAQLALTRQDLPPSGPEPLFRAVTSLHENGDDLRFKTVGDGRGLGFSQMSAWGLGTELRML